MYDFRSMVKGQGQFSIRRGACTVGDLQPPTRLEVLGAVLFVLTWAVVGCRGDEPAGAVGGSSTPAAAGITEASPVAAARLRASSQPSAPASSTPVPTCRAPSLELRFSIDGRDAESLQKCPKMRTGAEAASARCGEGGASPSVDWERFDAARR